MPASKKNFPARAPSRPLSREGSARAAVLILAAGLGKRMRSPLPKVLHPVGGQPLLFHILDQVREGAPQARIGIVVGNGREQVETAVAGNAAYAGLEIDFIHQAEQKGTGHAARCAMDSPWGLLPGREGAPVLVLPGDLPLLPRALIEAMLAPLARKRDVMRLLTCCLPDPTGYGRVVRAGKAGPVERIVEEKDASARERLIREVAASIYMFQGGFMKEALRKLNNRNAQGEYYLTDLVALGSGGIEVLSWSEPGDVRGVNDPWELAQAGQIFNERIVKSWALRGVGSSNPRARVWMCTWNSPRASRCIPG